MSTQIREVVLDFGTHSTTCRFQTCEYYCPKCGQQSVWEEVDGGDYYVGEDYCCTSCLTIFNLPGMRSVDVLEELPYRKMVEQLRSDS